MKRTNPQKKVSTTGRFLRLLGLERNLEMTPHSQELHIPIPTENYYNNQEEIKAALLEADRRKAEALMECRKRHFVC